MGAMLRESRTKWLADALDGEGIYWSAYEYAFTLVRGERSLLIQVTGGQDSAKAYLVDGDLVGRDAIIGIVRDRLAGEGKG